MPTIHQCEYDMIMICLHIGHVKDLPQGLIAAFIHLNQVCVGETIVVLVLRYLRWHNYVLLCAFLLFSFIVLMGSICLPC